MFAYISGVIAYKTKNYVVVDVNGLGYKVHTSMNTLCNVSNDDKVKLFTYVNVKEDALDIYGFLTKEELGIFELLISVSGVGPKAAISVLSTTNPSKFSLAVISDDISVLTSAQGIGKKTAQRIILELKDKISKDQLEYVKSIKDDGLEKVFKQEDASKEAVCALMVLGYTPMEANQSVAKVSEDNLGVEDIIKKALKHLI